MPLINSLKPYSINANGKKTHIRWWLSALFFILGVISYMDRANLAIVAEPMMRDLSLNKIEFGLLVSVFSLGYALSQIPTGLCAERFGARNVITLALILWSTFTILTAVVSNYILLSIVRFLFGVGEAPIFPANGVFNAYWFQKTEKARAAGLLVAGTYFGPVIAPLLTVAILTMFSWHMVFYVFGGIGLVAAIFWYICARNKPEEHPWVSTQELELIKNGRTIEKNQQDTPAPWRNFIKRSDFWAVGLHYFFVGYLTVLFLVWLPSFLQEARGFSMTHMGIGASFPWLTICLTVLGGGVFSDYLLSKNYSSLAARGSLALFGLAGFIIAITGAAYTDNKVITIIWLSAALGLLGLPVVASWAIAADKGRQFGGSVSAWMNLWGNLGGVASPLICGFLAQYFGWSVALMFNIVPIILAMLCWLIIKPDTPITLPKSQLLDRSSDISVKE